MDGERSHPGKKYWNRLETVSYRNRSLYLHSSPYFNFHITVGYSWPAFYLRFKHYATYNTLISSSPCPFWYSCIVPLSFLLLIIVVIERNRSNKLRRRVKNEVIMWTRHAFQPETQESTTSTAAQATTMQQQQKQLRSK